MALDNKLVPVEWLRTQFSYDPQTGLITNAEGRRLAKLGAQPCYLIPRGYLALKVYYKGVRYTFLAHRLAYALHTGHHPTHEIDHLDHDRTNNRWENLRDATRSQNTAYRDLPARELPKGVSFTARCKGRPFSARITVDGRNRYIGSYETVEAATEAFEDAAKEAFGDYFKRRRSA